MPFVALKIEVRSSVGMQSGLPAILQLLESMNIQATIALSHGPDRCGKRFSERKAMRASGFPFSARYGWSSVLKGRLLPSGKLRLPSKETLDGWSEIGHELIAGSHDPLRWQQRCMKAGAPESIEQFEANFKPFAGSLTSPINAMSSTTGHANRAIIRLEQNRGLLYGSDCAGSHPFWPVWDGEVIRCPQLPVTLPTLENLVAETKIPEQEIATSLSQRILKAPQKDQLFLIQADYEGTRFLPLLEMVLKQLKADGIELGTCKSWLERIEISKLPYHEITQGTSAWGLPALQQGPIFPG